jgi:hypothetical protein
MELVDLLERDAAHIVEEATAALDRSRLTHYEGAGHAVSRERLEQLYQFMVQSIRQRSLAPVTEYMAEVANDRFHAGYAIREVQIAINVLEEAIWNHIVAAMPAGELAQALGLVSTVLGAAKDALAQTYVSLASKKKAPSLDLSALFAGRTSG